MPKGGVFHRAAKRSGVDRRISIQARFDRSEIVEQAGGLDEPTGQHLGDVADVLRMSALDLRQRLGVEVEVTEHEVSFLDDERAPVFPAFPDRDEIIWR